MSKCVPISRLLATEYSNILTFWLRKGDTEGATSFGYTIAREIKGFRPNYNKIGAIVYRLKKINDLVCRIRKESNANLRLVHFNRLTPYAGSNDVDIQAMRFQDDFKKFMISYSGSSKSAHFEVTQNERRDLFQMPFIFSGCLYHC